MNPTLYLALYRDLHSRRRVCKSYIFGYRYGWGYFNNGVVGAPEHPRYRAMYEEMEDLAEEMEDLAADMKAIREIHSHG